MIIEEVGMLNYTVSISNPNSLCACQTLKQTLRSHLAPAIFLSSDDKNQAFKELGDYLLNFSLVAFWLTAQ